MNSIDRELIRVARENNLSEVRRLLSVGADVNAKDNRGSTPLHWASLRAHVQVAKELLEHGADIEAKDNGGWMPLHRASDLGHSQVVKELLDHGADIEAKNIVGSTPLHFAAMEGHVAVVNELLSPNDINGATTSILGKRKTRGANIDAKNMFGETPLLRASRRNHLVIVKALVSGGANILVADNHGVLSIHEAMRGGHSAMAKYLLQHFYATTRRLPLHELLQDLTWIGNPYSSKAPPLHAAFNTDVLGTDDVVEILEYLVGRNPELLSSRDQDGSLPLHLACRRGASFSIVQSLLKHYQASVMSVTPQGDLPLFLACDIPEPSLDTIFILMKLYPDLVYR
jgi:ankyrin repeat protein